MRHISYFATASRARMHSNTELGSRVPYQHRSVDDSLCLSMQRLEEDFHSVRIGSPDSYQLSAASDWPKTGI